MMSKPPKPAGGRPRRRCRRPAGRTSSRRAERRTEPSPRAADHLIRDIDDRLGALFGYCELAKIKNESGDALASRMDAAIETLLELSDLIGRLRSA